MTLALDPARSDLLVDAELSRFANEQPSEAAVADQQHGPAPRRFVVTMESLRRGSSRGMTAGLLAEWYTRRTGAEIPPAVRLLLAIRSAQVPPLRPARILVLTVTSADLLDGLLQHPAIRPWLGDRLGPDSVTIADDCLIPLQKALKTLGIRLEAE